MIIYIFDIYQFSILNTDYAKGIVVKVERPKKLSNRYNNIQEYG